MVGRASRASICLNIETGQREVVGNFPRHDVLRRGFSPDGQKVVMSLQAGNNANIFSLRICASRATTRLTNDFPRIHTGALLFAGRPSQIVFGVRPRRQQQIYVMTGAGGAPAASAFGDGSLSTAGVVATRRPTSPSPSNRRLRSPSA